MKPIIYDESELDFNHNGLGILKDAISCTVMMELNGEVELEMKYPRSGQHADEIADRRILLVRTDPISDLQPFRIYRIVPTSAGTITVYARHLAYDCMGIPIAPFSATSMADALDLLPQYAAVDCPFTLYTDKSVATAYTVSTPTAMWSLLGGTEGSLLDVYGGEYEFDGTTIKLLNRRGADRGVSIRYGKNLKTLEQDRNCASCYTAVYPYYYSDDAGLIQLPEKLVSAAGEYTYQNAMTLDLSEDFEETPTEDELRERAEKYVEDNDIGVPTVSWTVTFAQLEQTEEYKGKALLEQVLLGDTVTVVFPAMNVNATARAVEIKYNVLLERYESVTLGKVKSGIASTIVAQGKKLEDVPTTTTISGIISGKLANAFGTTGGSVRLLDTDGDGQLDELYIANDSDPNLATIVWRYNYLGWAVSQNGYNGPFTMGATLEDGFMADFVTAANLTAGTIQSADGSFFLDLDSGTIRIQGTTDLQDQIDEIRTNYRFTADGQYIGRSDAEAVLRLSAGIVDVLVAGVVASSFDRTGMTAEQATIDTLHIGDYTITTDNGHLTIT